MKATLSKSSTGNTRSKILDPKWKTAEIVLEVSLAPTEFAKLLEDYSEKEFEVIIK